jgi:hypothetical protein
MTSNDEDQDRSMRLGVEDRGWPQNQGRWFSSKLWSMVSSGLASKPVATVSPGLASKPLARAF